MWSLGGKRGNTAVTGQYIPGGSCKEKQWADRTMFTAAFAFSAQLLTRISGVTMLGLGAFLALARREA